jgi:hypothetical protein
MNRRRGCMLGIAAGLQRTPQEWRSRCGRRCIKKPQDRISPARRLRPLLWPGVPETRDMASKTTAEIAQPLRGAAVTGA